MSEKLYDVWYMGILHLTDEIGVFPRCTGIAEPVKVTVFNSSAVNVSWTPLASVHVTSYKVYYSRLTG